MRNYSANRLALIYSVILTIFVMLLLGLTNLISDVGIVWDVAIIIALICSTLSFLLLRFLLQSFIYDRIKLIYKSIHNRKEDRSKKSEKFTHNTDLISQVEEDVKSWAEEQENEMENMKQMNDYRKEFVGNVSHELKTPIFNIQGYTLTLLEGGLEDENINIKYLQKIEKNINRMITIVNDLDSITKLESGQLSLRIKPIDPLALSKDIVESIEDIYTEKNVSLEIFKHYEKSFNVLIDKEFIRQVISNLLINAIHYNNEGGFVKIELFEMDKNILIEVTDNGVGIPPEDISHVFERFYRVDKSRSLNSGGSGLGLAIVKHIIEAHGQTVNVRSTVGVGTTIAFTLEKE